MGKNTMGIDFSAVGMKAAGHAAGGLLIRQVNKLGFIKNAKPQSKGLITALIGYVAMPMLVDKLGLAKKKGDTVAAIAGHAGDIVGALGMFQAVNAVNAGIMPTVSGINGVDGIAGYERNPFIAGETLEVVTEVTGPGDEPEEVGNIGGSEDLEM